MTSQISSTRASFNPPAEADWHRMISEAAYFLAQRRSFKNGSALDDWLAAEALIKSQLSE
ncbi:MAG TPA: DUF2934 domain-containing protein [Steroidobacteraceae bacterium]